MNKPLYSKRRLKKLGITVIEKQGQIKIIISQQALRLLRVDKIVKISASFRKQETAVIASGFTCSASSWSNNLNLL